MNKLWLGVFLGMSDSLIIICARNWFISGSIIDLLSVIWLLDLIILLFIILCWYNWVLLVLLVFQGLIGMNLQILFYILPVDVFVVLMIIILFLEIHFIRLFSCLWFGCHCFSFDFLLFRGHPQLMNRCRVLDNTFLVIFFY